LRKDRYVGKGVQQSWPDTAALMPLKLAGTFPDVYLHFLSGLSYISYVDA